MIIVYYIVYSSGGQPPARVPQGGTRAHFRWHARGFQENLHRIFLARKPFNSTLFAYGLARGTSKKIKTLVLLSKILLCFIYKNLFL